MDVDPRTLLEVYDLARSLKDLPVREKLRLMLARYWMNGRLLVSFTPSGLLAGFALVDRVQSETEAMSVCFDRTAPSGVGDVAFVRYGYMKPRFRRGLRVRQLLQGLEVMDWAQVAVWWRPLAGAPDHSHRLEESRFGCRLLSRRQPQLVM